jgi:hypothetical protein
MKEVEIKQENNPTAEWKARRNKVLSCGICPPNKGENRKKGSKSRAKGWKDKTKNKKQFKRIKLFI